MRAIKLLAKDGSRILTLKQLKMVRTTLSVFGISSLTKHSAGHCSLLPNVSSSLSVLLPLHAVQDGNFLAVQGREASVENVRRSTFLMLIKRQDVNLKPHVSQAFSILL